jgi:hypothetical protein
MFADFKILIKYYFDGKSASEASCGSKLKTAS